MSSAIVANGVLRSKFTGCMLGCLIGDCLGAPFEKDIHVSKSVLGKYFSNLLSGGSKQILPYTDDTSMTLSIASSLVQNKHLVAKDVAKKFVTAYYTPPKRGYGENVIGVFAALKDSDFKDVFLPAKLQFGGSGSYGNGAAMRISPIALFNCKNTDELLKSTVKDTSCITHTHPHGVNGALLQCLAVHAALKLDSTSDLNPVEFISSLEERMMGLQAEEDDCPYRESLKKIKDIYLKKQEDISAKEIGEYLGNDVSATKSVPTAIYSFLRGMKPIANFECSNPFIRTIYFAISVGGDTDTIAAMAGSIAGAYYGVEAVPTELQNQCEQVKEVVKLAEQLYNVTMQE